MKDTSLDEVDKAFGRVEEVNEPDALPEDVWICYRAYDPGRVQRAGKGFRR